MPPLCEVVSLSNLCQCNLQSSGQDLVLRLTDAVPSTKVGNLVLPKSLVVRRLMRAQDALQLRSDGHMPGRIRAAVESPGCHQCLGYDSLATSTTTLCRRTVEFQPAARRQRASRAQPVLLHRCLRRWILSRQSGNRLIPTFPANAWNESELVNWAWHSHC
jgi:hypothetical protein